MGTIEKVARHDDESVCSCAVVISCENTVVYRHEGHNEV